jgi:hypothetical protein
MPRRIQLRRTKGWRKPADAVVVSRPSKFGNPLAVGTVLVCEGPGGYGFDITVTPQIAVDFYRQLMESRLSYWPDMHPDDRAYSDEWATRVAALRGRDLACWCPLDQPCHADVLLDLANRPEQSS